jgi:hypothetical protein
MEHIQRTLRLNINSMTTTSDLVIIKRLGRLIPTATEMVWAFLVLLLFLGKSTGCLFLQILKRRDIGSLEDKYHTEPSSSE